MRQENRAGSWHWRSVLPSLPLALSRELPIYLALLLVGAFSAWPSLLPTVEGLTWDEIEYIYSGRTLLSWQLPVFEWNPLVAFFYAGFVLPLLKHPNWLVLAARCGHVLLYGASFLTACLLGRKLDQWMPSWALPTLFVVSRVPAGLLYNSTDALYSVLSGLALWQFLSWLDRRLDRHIVGASLFGGLAAWSRNDGLLLVFVLGAVLLVASMHSHASLKATLRSCLAFAIPAGGLIAGYLALYWGVSGTFHLGTLERSYVAFEQGHAVIFADEYAADNPYRDAISDVRALFGTPEENGNSVFRAIRRHPRAYIERVTRLTTTLPRIAVAAYGGSVSLLLFGLAAVGAAYVVTGPSKKPSVLILAWFAPLAVYLLFFFRTQYFLLNWYLVLALSLLGVRCLADRGGWRLAWAIGGCGIVVVAVARGSLTWLALGALAAMLPMLISWAARASSPTPFHFPFVAAIILVILLSRPVEGSGRIVDAAGKSEVEEAAAWHRGNLPSHSRVAAYQPHVARLADMDFYWLVQVENPGELATWISTRDIAAVYSDNYLRDLDPNLQTAVDSLVDRCLRISFKTRNATILTPTANCGP
jgi:hypothetical protein